MTEFVIDKDFLISLQLFFFSTSILTSSLQARRIYIFT
jgi:hypothetical protein